MIVMLPRRIDSSIPASSITRRQLMAAAGSAATLGMLSGWRPLLGAEPRQFQIGICDWSLARAYDLSVFELAQQIGLDGVQVSFGKQGTAFDLRQADIRAKAKAKSRATGVQICSLGMGVLNDVPYADDERAEQWVAESIEVMSAMQPNPRIVLLAFFGKGDILDSRSKQDRVIQKLKKVAPAAEKAGIVLGVESWMNVADHLRILDAVGSSAVQVYYDVANMTTKGYNIIEEIRQLGRDRICQIHAKENGHLLGQGEVDFRQVKDVLDEIGWSVVPDRCQSAHFHESGAVAVEHSHLLRNSP